jgi:hypothetical protein
MGNTRFSRTNTVQILVGRDAADAISAEFSERLYCVQAIAGKKHIRRRSCFHAAKNQGVLVSFRARKVATVAAMRK